MADPVISVMSLIVCFGNFRQVVNSFSLEFSLDIRLVLFTMIDKKLLIIDLCRKKPTFWKGARYIQGSNKFWLNLSFLFYNAIINLVCFGTSGKLLEFFFFSQGNR